jgi:Fe-S cluster assembly protein SufD
MSAVPAFPTNRDENWRYANLRPLAKARVDAVATGPTSAQIPGALPAVLSGYERWVFVDGRLARALSTPAADSSARLLEVREAHATFAALQDFAATQGVDFALARANAARGDQVLHVALPDDAPHAHIEMVFVATAPAAAGTSYPRVQVHAGRNTRLCLVERHVSAGATDSAINAAVDVAVAADAQVEHSRLQHVAEGASCFDTLVAHVGERARYALRTVMIGGLTSRSTVYVKLAGRAASCELDAAAVAGGIQTHDLFAEIEHVAPETRTRELYRGLAADRGKLAFNGKMIVRETAHGADSDQSLKTLLTGRGAEAAARPQLEIYTDRVRAVHGATTGKLDDTMLFYLLTRGIDRATAQALLQWAFIEDAVSRVSPAELRREIEKLIEARLGEVAALGLLAEGVTP